ncbi:mannose-ethanolamine phosphotransferase GPI11 Ecym_3198 [Eremothecium cymbalariae DBVPG|uniref:Glycosylphosphatidylinositol anchor biosynthesis protein 11 n=1 Tax=Eremothecium cymbalariae (strain CBS 270.75 / DBVPG 7215 / KCTC 17166 / NRRL Y-17582) TaxID=931890 RepID=G8JRC8_ERECY|nr:Hypothetical protein Ecym_3198 [Eremothecium cymbalariae DBVPG\
MVVKKRQTVKKKFVSFSDDDVLSRANRSTKSNTHYDSPPVYVRRTPLTIPIHLPVLCYWFAKCSKDYDIVRALWYLAPSQLLYLVLQFNRCTVYGNKIIKTNHSLLLVSAGTTFLLTIPCMLFIILFGAPISELLKKTWLLSLHCCVLAYPAIYSVYNSDFKVGYFKKYFISIAIGCWISCVVIPLDWDRPWQAWPTPIVIGGYIGAFFGYTFGSFL